MTTRKVSIPAYEHTCCRCGFTWTSQVEKPVACGDCKSRLWNTPAGVKKRGRPRTLPVSDELREDLTLYNREAKRRSRAKQKAT